MSKLQLYNTLTRKKEEFKPLKKNKVTIYHCGPTVYWTQHIGNMRGMTCADLITRSLNYLDFKVILTRNYTDVGHLTSDADQGEDKMEKAAKRDKLSPDEVADKYIKIFENDVKNLNNLEPKYKPRATQCIKPMIKMVKTLINKGYAYTTDLAVYFDVSKAKDYTKLSRQNLDNLISQTGQDKVIDKHKKNTHDFAIWLFRAGEHKNALQYWKSPFKSKLVDKGQGFPGWHLECSVMAKKYLGDTIDIHMGGIEHIPIHHTNEIAQSEAANGVNFANYWLHNEHLIVNQGKMAKSEGTSYSLGEIKEKGFDPLSLRYFFLNAHYRSKQNFTWQALEAANKGYSNLKKDILSLGNKKGKVDQKFKEEFIKKISDDFNIPQALALIPQVLKSNLSDKDKLATLSDFDKVFGLNLDKIKEKKIAVPAEVEKLAEDRLKARQQKDWAKADEFRNKIQKLGFTVEDKDKGFEIKKHETFS